MSVGVFGTLVMHNPKVPQVDFSVKVMRHKWKIYLAVENFGGGNALDWEKSLVRSVAWRRMRCKSVSLQAARPPAPQRLKPLDFMSA